MIKRTSNQLVSQLLKPIIVVMLAAPLAAAMLFALTERVSAAEMMHGLDGTMRVTTPFRAGADECYRAVGTVQEGEAIMVLARNTDNSWLFIWSEAGDGWVRVDTVNAFGAISSLPVWTDRFNGESCGAPPPQIDARICGRPGIDTAATTIRWTDIFSTADPDQPTGRAYPPNTALTLTGRDFWGCFVRVRSSTPSGNGWIPVQAIDTRAIMSLPVLVENSGGCQIVDGAIVGCSNDDTTTQGDIRTVRGATTIYNEPNTSVPTGRTVPADGRVRLVSERSDGWVRVRSRYGNGYIQASQLNPATAADSQGTMLQGSNLHSDPDGDARTNTFVPEGTQVTVLGFASGWIRIEAPQGMGWVPQRVVSRR